MIATWTLEHFKSVYQKTKLKMAPLTLFAGANSSGKSTLIQSILLTAQTLQNPVQSRPVILNGHILRLGTFNDIVSDEHRSERIMIGFDLLPHEEESERLISPQSVRYFRLRMAEAISAIQCSFAFSSNGIEAERDVLQLQPHLEECRVCVRLRSDKEPTQEEIVIRRSQKSREERLRQYGLPTDQPQVEIASLEYEVPELPSPKRVRRLYHGPVTGRPVGASVRHFLPGSISVVYDAVEEQARSLAEAFSSPDTIRNLEGDPDFEDDSVLSKEFREILIATMREFAEVTAGTINWDNVTRRFAASLADLEKEFSAQNIARCYNALPMNARKALERNLALKSDELVRAARAGRKPEYRLAYIPLPDLTDPAVDYIHRFFSRMVKYLGPLRDEPKPVYPLAGGTDPNDIGFRGEHTAAVLEVQRNTPIKYIASSHFASGNLTPESSGAPLVKAVLDWLDYMGVASNVKTEDKGKLGHEMKVAASAEDSLHDLTHVGVGVSQVLPILVQSLLAEPGSTLIFEQPELHLHPRVQTRLADFFVSMTMLRKQCIVETHSEYLINRLRYLAAISDGERLSNDMTIYFVEKEGKRSTYRSVRMNRFGVIEDWPKGFFDESEDTAASILRAGMSKRIREERKPYD